jgi:hypothetical protein
MKKMAGITMILAGLLLVIVPRYILPACEFEGFSRMHCSDTAQAERVAGIFLAVAGIVTLVLKPALSAGGAILGLALSVSAAVLPDKFGYCHSVKMPCNYGMVPAIRLIAVVTALIMVASLIGMFRAYSRKGKA